MPRPHDQYREWLHLEADGGLTTAERARLHRHLLSCSGCREDRERVLALDRLLGESRIPVRPGFRREVLEALPPAGWEARHPRSWLPSLAALALLIVAAAVLSRFGGEGVAALPLGGALLAMVELFRSTALAGAGLLAASWRGLGMALWEALGGSGVNLVAFLVLVVGLDLLLLRLLVRAWRSHGQAAEVRRRSRR